MHVTDKAEPSIATIAVLMTCFNRRAQTLACVRSLFTQQQIPQLQLQLFLVDDGDDGTGTAIAAEFPQVHVIQGNGQLYWAGGMRLAWQQALATQECVNRDDLNAVSDAANSRPTFAAYLWLNDDVELQQDALCRLWQSYQELQHHSEPLGALVGTVISRHSGHVSYGGRRQSSRWLPLTLSPPLVPTEQSQCCDFINGNICLISASGVETLGILSARFTHSMADFDYGLRLKAVGFSLWVAPGSYGYCEPNPPAKSVLNKARPFAERLASLSRPNVWPPADEWSYFVRCHGGPLWPILWCKVQLRRWLPALWLWWMQRDLS